MSVFSKYRGTASFIAAVFLAFNVGLPIVVASCPMSENRTASCGTCNDEAAAASQKLTNYKNTSCCLTIFADKNTTEFVKSKSELNDLQKVLLPTSNIPNLTSDFSSTIFQAPILHLPSSDIPIFTSSLLI